MQIYLDYAASTPTRPEVVELMHSLALNHWGNPSSIHRWGERSALVMERARMQVADLLHVDPTTIVFTGGGTESNHLALFGITRRFNTPQHLIISAIEHAAIAHPAEWLERQGWQVTRLGVDHSGRVDPDDLARAFQANTVLVSIIYGHNEVGTLQSIEPLGALCRSAGVYFHTDAVQAVGRIEMNLGTLPIDLLSLSGHKLYASQGVGALYVRRGVELMPYLMGGGQEGGMRSGTPAVTAIAGLGLAAELAGKEMAEESLRLRSLRNHLWAKIQGIPDLYITGDPTQRLPHHLSLCHRVLGGRSIVRAMSHAGIGISAGSACSSGTILPSPTLLSMGYTDREALGGIRLTLGKLTTLEEVEWAAMTLEQVLHRARDLE